MPERNANEFRNLHWNGRRWLVAHGSRILESLYGPGWHFTQFDERFAGATVGDLAHTNYASESVTTLPQLWIGANPPVVSFNGQSWSSVADAQTYLPPGVTSVRGGDFDEDTSTLVLGTEQGIFTSITFDPPPGPIPRPGPGIRYIRTSSNIANVVFSGRGIWLAGANSLLFSTDAQSWTSVLSRSGITSIAASEQSFVALVAGAVVGQAPGLFRSPTGQTWTPVDVSAIFPGAVLRDIVWTGSQYLLATSVGLYTLPLDGSRALRLDAETLDLQVNAIASSSSTGSGRLVAVGIGDPAIQYSDDAGATWSFAVLDFPMNVGNDVLYSGGIWTAVGQAAGGTNVAYHSSDGATWTLATSSAGGGLPGNVLVSTHSNVGYLTVRQTVDLPAADGQSVHHVSDRYYSATLFTVSARLSE